MAAIRPLAAILAADVAGYSRLMGANEGGRRKRACSIARSWLNYYMPSSRPKTSKRPKRSAGNFSRRSSLYDSLLEGTGFELVWGFSCQVVLFGLRPVLCSKRGTAFFVPSPAIRFPERAEGGKGPKR
jgi:hypothetical protein